MAKFDIAFKKVIKAEGGYVRDRDDKGGETYLGISRKFHKNSLMWKYVDEIKNKYPNLTYNQLTAKLKKDIRIDDEVKKIYKEKYWDKLRCNEITSQKLAEQLFDMGVNAGTSNAVKLMQRLMNHIETGYISDIFIEDINKYAARNKFRKI